MTYLELENLRRNWSGEVCLFGAGTAGQTQGYDFVNAAGFPIDFYCDNGIPPGTVVNGIEVRDVRYLYGHKETILVFLTVGRRYREEILGQLGAHGIGAITVDERLYAEVLDSVDKSGEEKLKRQYHAIYDDQEYLKRMFRRQVGYEPNLESPKTFNEKLQWLKLYDRRPEYTVLSDKYTAKGYVAEKIGKEYVVPTLGVWDTADEIDPGMLPDRFVIKCTHDSGSVIVVRDKREFDWEAARRRLTERLGENYYWIQREYGYKDVKPRILAEAYLEDGGEKGALDYKFYCFNGEPKFLYLSQGLEDHATAKISFLNMDWTRMEMHRSDFEEFEELPKKPGKFSEMAGFAKILSKGFPFARADFYENNGKVYFGEMTFYPGGGFTAFSPEEWDRRLGDWIHLARRGDYDGG